MSQTEFKSVAEVNQILTEHQTELSQRYNIKAMRVFGSYLRGEQTPKSDIDILVEFVKVPNLFKIIELERYLTELLGTKVDLVEKNGIRPELRESILNRSHLAMKREYWFFIKDIIESSNSIAEFTTGLSVDEFKTNDMIASAVCRKLEIIGEASKKIPEEVKQNYSQIPWKEMAGLRDKVAHHYWGIEYDKIWEIITEQLPPLRPQLEKMVEEVK